ncbi:response regulator transcription factor [Erysipelotrichaceae bacterium RD49]|nr:response regulator transcription factor [Erysipelotrichaceae bacterium RD49]
MDLKQPLLICDDSGNQIRNVEQLIETFSDSYDIQGFTNTEALLEELATFGQPAIILLDIVLKNGEDGIETAKRIHALSPDSPIIFISAYLEKVFDVYEAEHCYFVYKPIMTEKLPAALAKAQRILSQSSFMVLHETSQLVRLRTDEILCIDRSRRMSMVTTATKVYQVKESRKELEERLPVDSFIQCHRNYTVNLAKIRQLSSDQIELENGLLVPVSRRKHSSVATAFHSWLSRFGEEIL